MLSVNDLIVYQNGKVIDGLSFDLERGQTMAIFGESGSGKTTLLRAIAGLHQPKKGSIIWQQTYLSNDGLCLVPPEARGVGMVFQDYALFPHLNVEQNISFGIYKASPATKKQTVEELLQLIGLSDIGSRFPHQLSGGEQQRVALARALATKPNLLLLDEPFSNLDDKHRIHLVEQLKNIISECQLTTILVSHEMSAAKTLADRIEYLENGRFLSEQISQIAI